MKKGILRLFATIVVASIVVSCGKGSSNGEELTPGLTLTEISETNFPMDDDLWTIAATSATSAEFQGLISALKYISYNYPEREISLDFPNLKTIPDYAFLMDESESKISLNSLVSVSSSKVTTVGSFAFYENLKLRTIYFPSALEVYDCAFAGCTSLVNVELGSVETLGKQVFSSCLSLVSIAIKSASEIGDETFKGCASLTDVSLSSTLLTINKGLFLKCTSLVEIELPAVTTISNDAFGYCSSLEQIKASSAIYIETAFNYCTSLKSVELASTNGAIIASFNQPFYGSDTSSATLKLGSDNSRNVVGSSYVFDSANVVTFAEIVLL